MFQTEEITIKKLEKLHQKRALVGKTDIKETKMMAYITMLVDFHGSCRFLLFCVFCMLSS